MKERQKVDSHFTCCVKAMLCLSWLGLGTAGLILYHLHDNLNKPPPSLLNSKMEALCTVSCRFDTLDSILLSLAALAAGTNGLHSFSITQEIIFQLFTHSFH